MNFITLVSLLSAVAFKTSSGNDTKRDEKVDALAAVKSLPQAVLLAANEDIPLLECLTADLTEFNASARTFTYTWHLKGQYGEPQKDISLQFFIDKDRPDFGVGFINGDTSTPTPGRAAYSDYKSCLILKLYLESQNICMQWVAPEVVNAVPRSCSAAMNDNCGSGVLLYSDDACS